MIEIAYQFYQFYDNKKVWYVPVIQQLKIYIQSYGNIQSSGFSLTVKILGHMVFSYWVCWLRSNVPASFLKSSLVSNFDLI